MRRRIQYPSHADSPGYNAPVVVTVTSGWESEATRPRQAQRRQQPDGLSLPPTPPPPAPQGWYTSEARRAVQVRPQQPPAETLVPGAATTVAANTEYGWDTYAPSVLKGRGVRHPPAETLVPGAATTTPDNTAFGWEATFPAKLRGRKANHPPGETLPPGAFTVADNTAFGWEGIAPVVSPWTRSGWVNRHQPDGLTLPVSDFTTSPPPPPPPVPIGGGYKRAPYVSRAPIASRERTRAHIDKTQNIFNSLLREGYIRQTGPTDFALSGAAIVTTRDPTVTDDSSVGAFAGAFILNTMTQALFICVDPTVGAAAWKTVVLA